MTMPMGRFSPTNTLKEVFLAPQEALICKFPAVWINLSETLFNK